MDFIELATRTAHLDLQIEEMELNAGSTLVGQSVKTSPVKSALGIIIVAIKKPGGEMFFNPSSQAKLKGGDTVVAIGESKNLERLEKRLNPQPASGSAAGS